MSIIAMLAHRLIECPKLLQLLSRNRATTFDAQIVILFGLIVIDNGVLVRSV